MEPIAGKWRLQVLAQEMGRRAEDVTLHRGFARKTTGNLGRVMLELLLQPKHAIDSKEVESTAHKAG